ncbi:MAG: addiction module protein [Verrucomicrobiaceae bacterium]|nr:addiction module protein [Verrucomicrobiaceae bacterium]
MNATLDSISSQAFVLPAEQRMRLALALMESVETDSPVAAGEAWTAEISHRIADYDAGSVKGVPAAEVFRKLREIAPDR